MTDMRDKIVSTLRKPPETSPAHKDRFCWDQAELVADEIMELVQARIDKLTEALKVMAEGRKTEEAMGGDYAFILDRYIDTARAALKEDE